MTAPYEPTTSDIVLATVTTAKTAVDRMSGRFDLPSMAPVRVPLASASRMLEDTTDALEAGDYEAALIGLSHATSALERALYSSKVTVGDRKTIVPTLRMLARSMGRLDGLL